LWVIDQKKTRQDLITVRFTSVAEIYWRKEKQREAAISAQQEQQPRKASA
jgi:hypothetical protein